MENGEHEKRVDAAFDAFEQAQGARLDAQGQDLLRKMREAASSRDPERLRSHLVEVRDAHGWLYRELVAHPALSTLLDELALWGI